MEGVRPFNSAIMKLAVNLFLMGLGFIIQAI